MGAKCRVGRRHQGRIDAATGERIVAFGRVGKPLEKGVFRPFWISIDAPGHDGMQRILKLDGVRL